MKLGAVDARHGTGTANTSLVWHAGKLMALHEGECDESCEIKRELSFAMCLSSKEKAVSSMMDYV